MSTLAANTCKPCEAGVAPLHGHDLERLQDQIAGWDVVREHHLTKEFKFPDFITALAFVNRIGQLAEQQSHHPDIILSWGRVRVDIWTHKIDGLSENDFILAAKIDELPLT